MNETELRNKIREAVRTALQESAAVSSESSAPSAYFAPWTGIGYEAHPSQQKFNISEASQQIAAQLGDLLELTSSQNCTIETGKLCDQCGMCRSLGF